MRDRRDFRGLQQAFGVQCIVISYLIFEKRARDKPLLVTAQNYTIYIYLGKISKFFLNPSVKIIIKLFRLIRWLQSQSPKPCRRMLPGISSFPVDIHVTWHRSSLKKSELRTASLVSRLGGTWSFDIHSSL